MPLPARKLPVFRRPLGGFLRRTSGALLSGPPAARPHAKAVQAPKARSLPHMLSGPVRSLRKSKSWPAPKAWHPALLLDNLAEIKKHRQVLPGWCFNRFLTRSGLKISESGTDELTDRTIHPT